MFAGHVAAAPQRSRHLPRRATTVCSAMQRAVFSSGLDPSPCGRLFDPVIPATLHRGPSAAGVALCIGRSHLSPKQPDWRRRAFVFAAAISTARHRGGFPWLRSHSLSEPHIIASTPSQDGHETRRSDQSRSAGLTSAVTNPPLLLSPLPASSASIVASPESPAAAAARAIRRR